MAKLSDNVHSIKKTGMKVAGKRLAKKKNSGGMSGNYSPQSPRKRSSY